MIAQRAALRIDEDVGFETAGQRRDQHLFARAEVELVGFGDVDNTLGDAGVGQAVRPVAASRRSSWIRSVSRRNRMLKSPSAITARPAE